MSDLKVNSILDRSGGDNVSINGVVIRPGFLDNENRIINGAFDVWQRGTSFTTSAYGADRWVNVNVGGTVTMSRQSFTIGEKLGKNNPKFYLRQSCASHTLASHFGNVTQRIEGVESYAGETITVLGWARRSSGAGNASVDVFQFFGTGGSPSSSTFATPVSIPLTTSWEPFAATFTLPSVTGKVLGTNSNDHLGIRFWTSAGSDYNSVSGSLGLQTIGVDFWGIHIRRGTHAPSAALDYVQPELGPELARCQRYFIRWQGVVDGTGFPAIGVGYASSATAALYVISTPVSLRAKPSASFVGTITGTAGASGKNLASITTLYVSSPSGIWMNGSFPTGATWTAGDGGLLYCQNDPANYFQLDAEL